MRYPKSVSAAWLVPAALILCNCGANSPLKVDGSGSSKHKLSSDPSLFNFESGTQGWSTYGSSGATATSATWVGSGSGQTEVGPSYYGTGSVKWNLNAASSASTNGYYAITTYNDVANLAPGDVLSFFLYVPAEAKSAIGAVQPFTKSGQNFNYIFTSFYSDTIPGDGWMQMYYQIPATADPDIKAVGIALYLNGSVDTNFYVDSVDRVN